MTGNLLKRYFLTPCLIWLALTAVAFPNEADEISDRLDVEQPSGAFPEPTESATDSRGNGFVLPPAPATRTTASEAAVFELKGVVFEGNTAISDDALQAVAASFIGRQAGVAELEELRYRLTRLYVDRGFINSGAIVKPGQAADSGVVVYTIEEGRLNRVHVTGNGRLRAGYIEKRIWPDSRQPFDMHALEERFQLLLENPLIRRMDGSIQPGAESGEAILHLDVEREKPYCLYISMDNHRPPSTGAERAMLSGWVGNLTGQGDMLDFSIGVTEGAEEGSVGFSIPLNARDTTLSLYYSRNENAIIEEPLNDIDVESESEDMEARVMHPIFRNMDSELQAGAALALRKSKTYLLDQPFSFSPGVENGLAKVTALRLVQSYMRRGGNQALALRSTFSIGVDLFDPTLHGDDPPDSRYLSWLGQAQYTRRIGKDLGLIVLKGALQLSDDRLLPQEQFAVGGADTVRGYRENALVRDNGFLISAEWRYPLLLGKGQGTPSNMLQLVSFMDFCEAWDRGKEGRDDTLHSVGAGLIFTPRSWIDMEIYWAHDIVERVDADEYNLQDDGIHFSCSLRLL